MRFHESKPSIVYSYDVHSKRKSLDGRFGIDCPLRPVEFIDKQMKLAEEFSIMLLKTEKEARNIYRRKRRELYPDYDQLEQEVFLASEKIEEMEAAIKRDNAKQRRKRATKEEQQAIKALRCERKILSEKLKARRDEIAKDDRIVFAQQESDEYRDRMNEESEKAINKAGLYQATKRAVVESVFQASKTSKKMIWYPDIDKWDGSGRLACQIQAQKTILDRKGPCTWAAIALGRYDTLIKVTRTGKYHVVHVRFGSDENKKPVWVECPIILHREWPADAVLKWVELVRYRTNRMYSKAPRYQYKLCFTLAREEGWDKPDLADSGIVAVNCGWRSMEHGLRVATWVADDGNKGELIIPWDEAPKTKEPRYSAGSVEYYNKAADLQSIRDKRFNEIRAALTEYFSTLAEIPEWLQHAHRYIAQVKSKDYILKLIDAWEGIPGDANIRQALVEWRKKEIHLEEYQSGVTTKFIRWRQQFYYNFWARLRRQYRTALIGDINYAKMRKDLPAENNENQDASIKYRNLSSSGLLSKLCTLKVEKVDAKNASVECHHCGHKCDWPKEQLTHICESCGTVFDQDENFCMVLLKRYAASQAGVGA